MSSLGLLAFLLALNGEPKAQVAVAEGCHSAEAFAATDLAHWVEAISGAKLAVVTNVPAINHRPTATIFVGSEFAKGIFDDDLTAIGESDGFAIREKDGNVYLFGTKPRAAIYATSAFLEENTDIIWARPSEAFGTVFSNNPTLNFKITDRRELPAFRYHGWNVVAIRGDWPTAKWVARNRGNLASLAEGHAHAGELGFRRETGGHIYWWMAHPKDYFATHPEFFGYSKLKNAREPETLCLTAPGLMDVAVSNLVRRIEEQGGETIEALTIGSRDSWTCCQCDNCTAPIVLKDGSRLGCQSLDAQRDCKYYSTRFWLFIGELATRLRARFPNLNIIGSGYMYAAEPPACDIPDFMFVDFCPIGDVDGQYALLDPRQRPTWRNRILEWNRRFSGKIYYYEYWCSYDAGFANIRTLRRLPRIRQNLIDLKDVLKGVGVDAELTPDSPRTFSNHSMESEWDAGVADRWVIARLVWDPTADVAALTKRFFARTYREAASQMTAFYAQLAKNEWDPAVAPKARNPFNCKEPAKARKLLDEALAAAVHPRSRKMIERLIGQWEVAREKCGVRTVPLMDRQEHFREPGATCWETCLTLPEFMLPGYFTWGVPQKPAHMTEVRLLTDGTTLFLRVDGEVGSSGGDWVYLSIVPQTKGAKTWRMKLPLTGEAKVLEVPLAGLGVDRSVRGTYPTYYFLRYDGTTGEESTVGGAKFGLPSGTVSF